MVLRNSDAVENYEVINQKILECGPVDNMYNDLKQIVTHCGCDELFDIFAADKLFNRIIVMFDGDVRIKEKTNQPRVCDFLEKYYNAKEFGVTERKHEKNMIFAPGYFAPESYLYKIIYQFTEHPEKSIEFWRGQDKNEETALYTSDKIKNKFIDLPKSFNNGDLKKIFGESPKGEIWEFIKLSRILVYYYFDYIKIIFLLDFIEDLKQAYTITKSLTVANRWV